MLLYLLVAGFLLLFILSVLFVVLKLGPLIILQPHRITAEDYRRCTNVISPADLQLPFNELSVHTNDGVTLVGWFVSADSPAKGTIIYLHGVGDNRISGLPVAKTFCDHGYNVCLYDSRRHGDSGGKFCTYGYQEKFDVEAVIGLLGRSYGSSLGRIGLFGVSMGAAVALQSAAIDDRIVAVVAEGCFTDLRTISLDRQRRIIKLRWEFLGNLVMNKAERIAGFECDVVSPLKALEGIQVPVLFAHGTEDSIISPRYSEMLYRKANEPKELYYIRNAYHNNTWIVGGKEYEEKLISFFDRWLAPTSSTNSLS
ncbi:MAG: alpha/beta hydrolase [Bacteroidota bacterium]